MLAYTKGERDGIEQTQQRRQELNVPVPNAIDPQTKETYVLNRKAV